MGNKAYCLVTTSQNARQSVQERAIDYAKCNQLQFAPRTGSLDEMSSLHDPEPTFFIFTATGMYAWYRQNAVHFHPNMAKLRITHLMQGKHDRMTQVMSLKKGERVLDCTMGMGTDAIVASHVVGQEGYVKAVESEEAIFHLVRYGLATYDFPGHPYLIEAMRRIHPIHDEGLNFLTQASDQSFHVVYFDPMFRDPITTSSGIAGIRGLSNRNPLTEAHIQQAIRVAQRTVVLKERPGSDEFRRLGFLELPSSRGASVAYGVIPVFTGRG